MRSVLTRLFITITFLLLAGCEGPSLDGRTFKCATASDCGEGYVCEGSKCNLGLNNQAGVYPDRLVFGMSAAMDPKLSPLGGLGQLALAGFLTYFDKVNAGGGVHGRRLELLPREDKYDPETTKSNVGGLIGGGMKRLTFALVGVLGTETSIAAAEIAINEKVVFFAPGSGFDGLEADPPARYIFNVRGRYSEEGNQLMSYAMNTLKIPGENVGFFGQGVPQGNITAGATNLDAYGMSVYKGVRAAMPMEIPEDKVFVGSYTTKSTDIKGEVGKTIPNVFAWLLNPARKTGTDGTINAVFAIAALPDSAVAFICGLEGELLKIKGQAAAGTLPPAQLPLAKVKVQYLGTSVIGAFLPDAFGANCSYTNPATGEKAYLGVGTIVATPVPDPASNATGVIEYREDMSKYRPTMKPDTISLEAYLSARLLVEGLKKHGRELTTESFVDTLEKLTVDIGIGSTCGFTTGSHQATHKHWGQKLKNDLSYEALGSLTQ